MREAHQWFHSFVRNSHVDIFFDWNHLLRKTRTKSVTFHIISLLQFVLSFNWSCHNMWDFANK